MCIAIMQNFYNIIGNFIMDCLQLLYMVNVKKHYNRQHSISKSLNLNCAVA